MVSYLQIQTTTLKALEEQHCYRKLFLNTEPYICGEIFKWTQIHHELKHTLSRGVDKRVGKIEELTAMFRNPIFTFTLATLVF